MSKMDKRQSMDKSLRLLLIDDNPDDRALTIRELKKEFEIQVEEIIDAEGFAHALEKGTFDIVITDYQLRWSNGLEILGKIRSRYPDCIVIMFTATGDEEIAVEAMKKGLDDYVLKSPKHFKRLPVAVKAATKKAQQRQRLREAEEELQESEKRYRSLFEDSPISLWEEDYSEVKKLFDSLRESGVDDFRAYFEHHPEAVARCASMIKIVDVNKATLDLYTGRSKAEFMEGLGKIFTKESLEYFKEPIIALAEGKTIHEMEAVTQTLTGEKRHISVKLAVAPGYENSLSKMFVSVMDLTDRKLAEEKIQASIKEKEVLLKEIHHRVKNNLQIISSLLDLSRRRTENQEAVDLLSDARAKVHTMALIHAQLYQSDRFDRIDMGRHIQELFNFLAAIYETKSRFVTYLAKPSDVFLELTQAIPCSLVLNELISNAFKHAFKEGEKGRIEASIQSTADDTILIKVKDDGRGIPEEIDIDKTNSLGFKLARNLVQGQLGGKIRVEGNGGTEIVIEFK